MAEALGIAAGVIGIIVPALHGARLLLDDFKRIKDAPKTVESLTTDLAFFISSLESVKAIEPTVWDSLGAGVADRSKAAIAGCATACDTFRGDLRRWTKRSRDGQLSWRDRTSIGFWRERHIKALSEQLQSCKLTFNSVIGVATLYSTLRNNRNTEDIKKALVAQEAEIHGVGQAADDQLQVATRSLADLQVASQNDEDEDEDDLAGALFQLKEEVSVLKSVQSMLEELRSSAKETIERAAESAQDHSTNVTFGNYNSGSQVGVSHAPVTNNFGSR